MTGDIPADKFAVLERLSKPASLYTDDEIRPRCWPHAALVYDFWDELRGEKAAPPRKALAPARITKALPFLSLFDVKYEPFTLKCRLMGTAFAEAIGYDATGNSTDDYPMTDMLVRRAQWICAQKKPLLVTGLRLVWSPERNYKTYDTLSLPFMAEDGTIETILYLNQFHAP